MIPHSFLLGAIALGLSVSALAQSLKDASGPAAHAGLALHLTSARPASAQAAAKAVISEVKDGDALWVTIASARPLSEVAQAYPGPEAPAWFELHLAPGPAANPKKDFGSDCFIKLTPEQAAKTSYTLSLAPATALAIEVRGRGGKASGSPTAVERFKAGCFLNVVAGMRAAPGLWSNRLTLRDFNPSSPTYTQALVSAPITVDVSGGFRKYAASLEALDRCAPKTGQVLVCN